MRGAERLSYAELLPGWNITGGAMTNAIPDGDDFLLGMTGAKPSDGVGTGVMRWRRGGKRWRPVSFVPISGGDYSCEPSLVRDVDGALLFCARGRREPDYNDIHIWRSDDGGETWTGEPIIHPP